MPSVINTNIASLNAQRNLSMSQTTLATSLQRLSSGLRINSAKDDAAGLAISERFSTQIRGLNQAVRNANDGVSMAQTGEGALAEMGNNLQRIRELAVQAANVTNSASDRAALNLEVQQRLAEIDRTAAQTSFNGQKILNGEIGNATFQVGANVGETISVGFTTSTRIASMGAAASASSGVALNTLINGSGTPAVAGSYTKSSVAAFDFTNSAATQAVYTTGSVLHDYSTVAATQATYQTGSVLHDYSTVAATQATYQTGNVIHDYSTIAATAGKTVQAAALVSVDASAGTGTPINFTVDGNAVNLNIDYTTAGGVNQMVTDIQSDLGGNYLVSLDGGGKLVIATTTSTGITSAAPVVAGTDAGALLAAINSATDVSTAGLAADTSANKTLTWQGVGGSVASLNLTANITSAAQLQGLIAGAAGYAGSNAVATVSGNNIVFTSTAGAGDVVLGGTAALGGGSTYTGLAADTSANKTLTWQGVGGSVASLNLTANITSAAQLQGLIAGAAGYAGSNAVATVNGNNIVFTSTAGAGDVVLGGTAALGGGSTYTGLAADTSANKTLTWQGVGGSVASLNLTANITSAAQLQGLIAGAAGYAGSNAVATVSGNNIVFTSTAGAGDVVLGGTAALGGGSTNTGLAASDKSASFNVDGIAVSLAANTTNQAGLVGAIQTALDTANAGAYVGQYLVAASGNNGGFSITSTQAGLARPAVVNNFANGAAGVTLGGGTTIAAANLIAGTSLTIGSGELTIKVGSGSAIAVTGTFTTSAQLVNAINSTVQGVFASVNATNGKLDLTSSQDITLAGTKAGAGGGNLQYASLVNAAAGNISTGNTLTVAGAEDLIQRVDSSLATVSTLRSTFGAVQNRFESTMANLMGTAENLTAARSRIVDTDFAQETANLTRTQILQQAGVAMLAQANALPQTVLQLLK